MKKELRYCWESLPWENLSLMGQRCWRSHHGQAGANLPGSWLVASVLLSLALLLPPESCDTFVGHWGNVLGVSWQGRGAVPQKESQG